MNSVEKYHNLMLWKKVVLLLNPLIGLVSFLLVGLYGIVITAICTYITMMIFLAKNHCPWCNNAFFIYTEHGADMDGLSFLFQDKCINCGEPKENSQQSIDEIR